MELWKTQKAKHAGRSISFADLDLHLLSSPVHQPSDAFSVNSATSFVSFWVSNMCYDIHHYIILQFHFYTGDLLYWYLACRRPVWRGSGQLKYCFKHTTSYQPCSSLWLIWFNFQVWLIRSHGEIRLSIKQDLRSRLCSLFVFFFFRWVLFFAKKKSHLNFTIYKLVSLKRPSNIFLFLVWFSSPVFGFIPVFMRNFHFRYY